MPIAIIIALLLGGSVSYAAEGAVPGEPLYGIKTSINESVKGAFAVSTEAKAELEAHLAAERLKEAEKLAASGKLNAEVRADLEERFEEHAQRAETHIKELEENDATSAAEISSEFEASLETHEYILVRLGKTDATLSATIQPLLGNVMLRSSESAQQRTRSEAKVNTQAAAEGKEKAAAQKISEVRSYIEKHKTKVSAETATEARVKLKAAEEIYAQGETRLEAQAYGEAFALFQKSLRAAQEAKMSIESDALLEIEVFSQQKSTSSGNAQTSTTTSGEEGNIKGEGSVDATIKTETGNGLLNFKGSGNTEVKIAL